MFQSINVSIWLDFKSMYSRSDDWESDFNGKLFNSFDPRFSVFMELMVLNISLSMDLILLFAASSILNDRVLE